MTCIPHSPGPPRVALVIGATGAFGGHAAAALKRHGWSVRALTRDPVAAAAKVGPGVAFEWVQGDAMDPASVVAAARGADLIVHAANPPAYRNWSGTVLPMLEATLAAARASGARVMAPAPVYTYAPDAGPAIAEAAPHRPATRKGAIRVEFEARLRAAAADGVRVLVVRAGDFFGPGRANGALDWLVMRGRGGPTAVFRPGPARHAFAYLPDLAEATAQLLEQEAILETFASFHFAGHFLTVDELAAAVRRASGRPKLPLLPFPWVVVRLMGLGNETMRELMEMRYLWRRPIGLDNSRLVARLGQEPQTPLDTALRESLDAPAHPAAPAKQPARSTIGAPIAA